MTRDRDFVAAQERHFEAADVEHFEWQVGAPGFAPLEAALLAPVRRQLAAPFVEIGCGEGANFVHLGGGGLRVGIDRFTEKMRFAARRVAGVSFLVADASAVPLATASARCVLVRDLLHHLPRPDHALAEAVRILAPGGRLFVIEPNGANPLVAVQARLVRAEAGLRTSRREALLELLHAAPLDDVALEMCQALPISRLVLHHRFGWPALGRSRVVVGLLGLVESAAATMLPRSRWSYMVVSARRR